MLQMLQFGSDGFLVRFKVACVFGRFFLFEVFLDKWQGGCGEERWMRVLRHGWVVGQNLWHSEKQVLGIGSVQVLRLMVCLRQ